MRETSKKPSGWKWWQEKIQKSTHGIFSRENLSNKAKAEKNVKGLVIAGTHSGVAHGGDGDYDSPVSEGLQSPAV